MNDQLINQLDMIGTCLNVADLAENKPIWQGQAPADFATDLADLQSEYGTTAALAARLATTSTGPADDKDVAETVLENTCYVICRALAIHYKKTGDLTNRAKVAVRLGAIQKLRNQAVLDFAKAVRDLATTASASSDASKRGITPARIAALTAAIGVYEPLKNAPRGNIVNRASLRRELETQVAALVEAATDLDDLVIQFDSPEGVRFQAAWKKARQVIDAAHRPEPPADPATPPAVTPPPSK